MGLLNPQMCIAWRTIHQRASLKRAASQVGGLGFTSCGHRIRTGTSEGQESKVLCNMKGANWWETSWFCCTKGVIQRFANLCFHWSTASGHDGQWCLTELQYLGGKLHGLLENKQSQWIVWFIPWITLELKMKMTWWFLVGLGWVGGSWHVRWSWWRCWWRKESRYCSGDEVPPHILAAGLEALLDSLLPGPFPKQTHSYSLCLVQ